MVSPLFFFVAGTRAFCDPVLSNLVHPQPFQLMFFPALPKVFASSSLFSLRSNFQRCVLGAPHFGIMRARLSVFLPPPPGSGASFPFIVSNFGFSENRSGFYPLVPPLFTPHWVGPRRNVSSFFFFPLPQTRSRSVQ